MVGTHQAMYRQHSSTCRVDHSSATLSLATCSRTCFPFVAAGLTLHYVAVGLIYQPIPRKYLQDFITTERPDLNGTELLSRSNISLAEPGSISMENLHTASRKTAAVKPNPAAGDSVRIRMLKRTLSTEGSAKPDDFKQPQQTVPSVLESMTSITEEAATTTNDAKSSTKRHRVKAWLNKNFGLYLLKNADFVGIMFLMFGAFITLSIGTFVLSLGEETLGLTRSDVAFMLSICSLIEIVVRPASGIIFDLKLVRRIKMDLWLLAGVLTGVFVMLLPFCNSYPVFFANWACYILFAGCFHTHYIGIISDLVGSLNLASAMGMVRFMMGMGVLTGPTLCGVLKDTFGTYTYSFIFSGSAIVFFAFLFKVMHLIRKCMSSK